MRENSSKKWAVKFAEYEIMSTLAARKWERRGDKFFEKLEWKIFSKIIEKKFGDYEKVRIFAVPKRKGSQRLKVERKKFIENIEKTSSIINIHIYYKSVNSFINK